jgi:ABC-type dipeptide/oligopeptide/nickel transport system permease subunit
LAEIARRPSARQALGGALRQPATGDPAAPPPAHQTGPEREFTVEARSQWKTITRRFFRHKLAMTSLIILGTIVAIAFIGPFFWQWDYQEAVVSEANQAPSWRHPFGTDDIGQDMFARVMRGAQRSLQIAMIVAILSTTIGVVVGAVSGFFRGFVDWGSMRFVELIQTIPLLVLVATLSRIVQGNKWYLIPIVLGLVSWTTMARIVRGEFLSLREKEFVEAAAPSVRRTVASSSSTCCRTSSVPSS